MFRHFPVLLLAAAGAAAHAAPNITKAEAAPAASGSPVQVRINVTETSGSRLAWWQLWREGTPEPAKRAMVNLATNATNLSIGTTEVQSHGFQVPVGQGQPMKLNFRIANERNEVVTRVIDVPVPANTGPTKYEQVTLVMRDVFKGNTLGPGHPAVKHAVEVDMPARGGTPEALRTYLNSQNGQVRAWYVKQFGLRS